MPKLQRLSEPDVVKVLNQFGFEVHSQRGSHIKVIRIGEYGREILTIPNHKELKTGTLKAIYIQVTKYIPKAELQIYFYTDVNK